MSKRTRRNSKHGISRQGLSGSSVLSLLCFSCVIGCGGESSTPKGELDASTDRVSDQEHTQENGSTCGDAGASLSCDGQDPSSDTEPESDTDDVHRDAGTEPEDDTENSGSSDPDASTGPADPHDDAGAPTNRSDEFDAGRSESTEPGEESTGSEPPEEALYAIGSFDRSALLTSSEPSAADLKAYVFLTDDLSKDLEAADAFLSFDGVPGHVHAVGPENGGQLFVANTDKTVTRYDLGEGDELVAHETVLSFQEVLSGGAFGEYGSSFQFISPNKAYYLHGVYLVVWNPETMSITKTVDFNAAAEGGGVSRQGYATSVTALPLRVGHELFIFAGWQAIQSGRGVLQESAVVVVDTETDAVSIHVKDGCGFAREGVLGPDGKIYVATELLGTAAHFASSQEVPTASCLARFDPATKQFDPDFVGLGASAPLFGSVFQGPTGLWFTKVLDPELAAQSSNLSPSAARFLASDDHVFRWASLSLGNEPQLSVFSDAPPVGGSTVPLRLGERGFLPTYRFEGLAGARMPVETSFVELGEQGPLEPAFRVPGQAFSAVKLR